MKGTGFCKEEPGCCVGAKAKVLHLLVPKIGQANSILFACLIIE